MAEDGEIYLVTEAEGLVPMSAQPYDREDLVQELLECHGRGGRRQALSAARVTRSTSVVVV